MIRMVLIWLAMLASFPVPFLALAQQPEIGADDRPVVENVSGADDLIEGGDLGEVEEVAQPDAAIAGGALLRGLDRVSGALTDMTISNGEIRSFGPLEVTLGECRYPVDNPSGDAYAYMVIRDEASDAPLFEGWMIASSPALNAMDHRRYDVWVLRCISS